MAGTFSLSEPTIDPPQNAPKTLVLPFHVVEDHFLEKKSLFFAPILTSTSLGYLLQLAAAHWA